MRCQPTAWTRYFGIASAAAVLIVISYPIKGHAQYVDSLGRDTDIEIPTLILESNTGTVEDDTELDLANVVQVAARRVTTIQEAPAIVTVMTEAKLKRFHVRSLEQAIDRIPGWMRYGANYSQFVQPLSRGTVQAALLVRDGVSMFEPMLNLSSFGRNSPIELIKRIEVVTGPGGVLWGANSFLGVVSITSKGAQDIDGVEAALGYGAGPGEDGSLRGYVMAGIENVAGSGAELVLHTSFDSYQAPQFEVADSLFHSPNPQPNSLQIYGPLNEAQAARSLLFNINASLKKGSWRARLSWPVGVENKSLTFTAGVLDEVIPQDDLPECNDVGNNVPIDAPPCIDRGKVGRKNKFRFFDRFLTLDWVRRFGRTKEVGIAARSYLINFVREWAPLQVMPPIATILPGGLGFGADMSTYRAGANIDSTIDLGFTTHLLLGAEVFYEWLPDRTSRSRQGAGVETQFAGPYNLDLLPLPCPHKAEWDEGAQMAVNAEKIAGCPLTFAFRSDRTVLGSYASLQGKLGDNLILVGGVRAQIAPEEVSKRPYDLQLLTSGALVYGFRRNWHLKLNVTQGFRPPVFNNTDSNGEAVQVPGAGGLRPEQSRAFQAEVNARIKGRRAIREYTLRADYSYTLLENLILFPRGQYENSGTRAMHSGEFLGEIAFQGGHRVECGYTYLQIEAEDVGLFRTMPRHWFNLGFAASMRSNLESMLSLRVVSSFEDPNRLVEFRGLTTGDDGIVQVGAEESVSVNNTELVLDRIAPSAEMQFGLRYSPTDSVDIRAFVINALSARYYQPDATASFAPRIDAQPNPYEGFRASLTMTYRR